MEAFLYIWNDKLNSRMYIGSHKGIPTDGYICSSKPMLEQYSKRPNDFNRAIIAIGSYENIRRMETAMLKRVDAAHNPMYYNQSNGDEKFVCKYHTEASKMKMKGRKRPDLALWNKQNKTGIVESLETRQKKSISHIGLAQPQAFIAMQNNNDNRLNKQAICNVCGLQANKGNISRWHNQNCKELKSGQ